MHPIHLYRLKLHCWHKRNAKFWRNICRTSWSLAWPRQVKYWEWKTVIDRQISLISHPQHKPRNRKLKRRRRTRVRTNSAPNKLSKTDLCTNFWNDMLFFLYSFQSVVRTATKFPDNLKRGRCLGSFIQHCTVSVEVWCFTHFVIYGLMSSCSLHNGMFLDIGFKMECIVGFCETWTLCWCVSDRIHLACTACL